MLGAMGMQLRLIKGCGVWACGTAMTRMAHSLIQTMLKYDEALCNVACVERPNGLACAIRIRLCDWSSAAQGYH